MPILRRADQLRPRKRPVQARSRRTVDAVLKAAAQVFTRRGYAGATTNHIAERAGVSVGSLYEYFPSKDALLEALMEAHLAEGETVLQTAAAEVAARGVQDLASVVRHTARAMVELHARDRKLHRILFEEAPLSRRVRQMLVDIETRAIERAEMVLANHPDVAVPDPALAAAVVVHTVEALTHRLVLHGAGEDDDAYVEEIVQLIVRYLRRGPGPVL